MKIVLDSRFRSCYQPIAALHRRVRVATGAFAGRAGGAATVLPERAGPASPRGVRPEATTSLLPLCAGLRAERWQGRDTARSRSYAGIQARVAEAARGAWARSAGRVDELGDVIRRAGRLKGATIVVFSRGSLEAPRSLLIARRPKVL